ncbi:GAI protein [Paenibacillus mucilaginosus 3016]|uniref:GAI protein n=1 Tax=Paenibacillus mucilaginosus 3016 TaxID=1116391 RepID=H6NCW2_9BACL|nr:GRAS family protein [Paenibacillus mucilaginosus]AFC29444.1 GAI protein [Paenibacillus mucilaginosus 3016]WFA18155.1 GAI protein [Paenibacillus mucilaginosus]
MYSPYAAPSAADHFGQLQTFLARTLAPDAAARTQSELVRFAESLRIDEEASHMLPYLFAKALVKRLDPASHEQMNLYFKQYDVPQITLFNLLASKFPLMNDVTRLANAMLLQAMETGQHVRLLEIGIGTGRQIVGLLHQLKELGKSPASFTIHAIEPNFSCLQEAMDNVGKAAEGLDFPVIFHPIHAEIEQLTDADWQRLIPRQPGLLVNASFALHHIRWIRLGLENKDEVLRQIRLLNPSLVVLCEPDSDHHHPQIEQRMRNCWNHFSALFELIDSVQLPVEHSRGLKLFFGREIEDILSAPETLRCERHEATVNWIARLSEAGFQPCPALQPPEAGSLPDVGITSGAWHVGFGSRALNLISVLCAVS